MPLDLSQMRTACLCATLCARFAVGRQGCAAVTLLGDRLQLNATLHVMRQAQALPKLACFSHVTSMSYSAHRTLFCRCQALQRLTRRYWIRFCS